MVVREYKVEIEMDLKTTDRMAAVSKVSSMLSQNDKTGVFSGEIYIVDIHTYMSPLEDDKAEWEITINFDSDTTEELDASFKNLMNERIDFVKNCVDVEYDIHPRHP